MPIEIDYPIDMPKAVEEFRNYKDSERQSVVESHYRLMRSNQTVEFVDRMMEKYSFEKPRMHMTIREAFKVLETYVDSSDPDVRSESSRPVTVVRWLFSNGVITFYDSSAFRT